MINNVFDLVSALFTFLRKAHTSRRQEALDEMAKRRSPSERLKEMLKKARERESLAIYLADLVLRHNFEKRESLEEFLKIAQGARAVKVRKALRVVYRWPDRFGRRLRDQLDAAIFARKLEERNRRLKRRDGNSALGLMASAGSRPVSNATRPARRVKLTWR